jgi:hypothetical protein
MGALATSKGTHISMVIPMIAYFFCNVFCCYILFEERHRVISPSLEKGDDQAEQDVGEETIHTRTQMMEDASLKSQ